MAAPGRTRGGDRGTLALFYVLGLGALWVQLASEYDLPGNDNAWFAASLVARPTAAGLGAEVLLRGLLFSMVVAALLLFVAYIVFKRREPNRQVLRLPPMILPLSAAVLGLLLFIVTSAEDRAPLVPTFRIVGGLVVLYFFSFFLYWILGGEARMYVGRAFAFYPRWLYSVIAVLAVLCMGGSVLFPGETRLSCLYRETAEGDVMDGGVISAQRAEELDDYRTLEGGFLGHSEGHWYVFDEENLQLKAIPDDEASRVIEGEFYVAYTRIGSEGKPVGDSVTEEETKSGVTYTLSGDCNPPTQ